MPARKLEDMFNDLENLPEHSVISFVHGGRFTYVAIKVRGTWYTSATERNKNIELTMSSNDLATALILDGCTYLQRVVNWMDV